MHVCIPLLGKSETHPLEVVKSIHGFSASWNAHHVLSNDSHLCFWNGACCTICSWADDRKELIHLHTFFFRRTGGRVRLSSMSGGAVYDYTPSHYYSKPTLSRSKAAQLSEDCTVSLVLLRPHSLMICGKWGGYASVRLNTNNNGEEILVHHDFLHCSGVPFVWGVCEGSLPEMVVMALSDARLLILTDSAQDVMNGVTVQTLSFDNFTRQGSVPCSIAGSSWGENERLVVVNYAQSRNVDFLCVAGPNARRVNTLAMSEQEQHLVSFPSVDSQTSLLVIDSNHIISVSLFADAACFCFSKNQMPFSPAANLLNDAAFPFTEFQWTTTYKHGSRSGTAALVRSDGECLVLRVDYNPVSEDIVAIVIAHRVQLLSAISCCVSTDGLFFFTISDPDFFLSPSASRTGAETTSAAAVVDARTGAADRRVLFRAGSTQPTPSCETPYFVKLLHFSDQISGVFAAYEGGECCVVPLSGETRRVPLATLEAHHAVRSVLVLGTTDGADERIASSGFVCVVGLNDGKVLVFCEAQPVGAVLSHCGPVDRLCSRSQGQVDPVKGLLFLSCCRPCGTVCIHHGHSAEILHIFNAPSAPLTALAIEPNWEYLMLSSGSVTNLWHVPTCRLENSAQLDFSAAPPPNLRNYEFPLASHRPANVTAFSLGTRRYMSVDVCVDDLIDALQRRSGPRLGPDVEWRLVLLLRSCGDGLTHHADSLGGHGGSRLVAAVLPLLGLQLSTEGSCERTVAALRVLCVAGGAVDDCTTHLGCRLAARSLLDEALARSTEDDAAGYLTELCVRLTAAFFYPGLGACLPEDPLPQARDAVAFFARRLFAVDSPAGDVAVRALCGGAEGDALTDERGSGGLTLGDPGRPVTTPFVVLCCLLGSDPCVLAQRVVYGAGEPLRGRLAACAGAVLERLEGALGITAAASVGGEARREDWVALAEGYALFAALHGPRSAAVVAATARAALGGRGGRAEAATAALREALLCRAVLHDAAGFLKTHVREGRARKEARQHRVIALLTAVVRAWPAEARALLPTLLDTFLHAYAADAADARARDLVAAAAVDFTNEAVERLSNISFQQYFQLFAVGVGGGAAAIYSLKTGGVVASFQADGAAAALGGGGGGHLILSYSSNSASHDVATVSERLDCVRVWRAKRSDTPAFVSFFTGVTMHFAEVATIELPTVPGGGAGPMGAPDATALNLCRLCWLSPQCLQFTSPWHKKLVLTL